MSDDTGTFEHADHVEPRRGEGYCTDDMARLLVAVAREPRAGRVAADLGRTAFRFLADAQGVTGTVRNRRAAGGRWSGRRGVEDCWGRTVWAFGAAVRGAPEEWMRRSAMSYFGRGCQQRSPWPRAMAFAGLGAAEVLTVDPHHGRARSLLADAVDTIGPIGPDAAWPWPEARLTYANAVLPDVVLAAGHLLDQPDLVEDGLTMLRFLLDRETVDGHLSPTPVGGAGRDDVAPRFDQQPIEVAALADACARAEAVTGDTGWRQGIELAAGWFLGDNDADAVMWDPQTGGGYDGLHATGPNLNEGTESTLALVVTLQRAWALEPVAG
jgi:hypothetical protein